LVMGLEPICHIGMHLHIYAYAASMFCVSQLSLL